MSTHVSYPSIKNLFRVDPDTSEITIDSKALHLEGMRILAQEKLDGMNVGIRYSPHSYHKKFTFLGREEGSQIPTGLLDKLLEITYENPEPWKNKFDETVIVYGEGVGYGINGNRHGFDKGEFKFVAFDVFEPLLGRFYNPQAFYGVMESMNIETAAIVRDCFRLAPEVEVSDDGVDIFCETLVDNFSFDTCKSFVGPAQSVIEGVIIRPLIELRMNNWERIIWKHKPTEVAAAAVRYIKKAKALK